MIDPKLIKAIAKSDYKANLVKYLEQLKDEVADIRKGKYTVETRNAVIEVIDTLLLDKLRVSTGSVDKDVDDWS